VAAVVPAKVPAGLRGLLLLLASRLALLELPLDCLLEL
jgi:hypothetical protein